MQDVGADPGEQGLVQTSLSRGKASWGSIRRFYKTAPLAAAGAAVLVFLLFIVIFADVLAPEDPNRTDYLRIRHPPSRELPLGADHLGRDALSRIIVGSRTSLMIAFSSVLLAKIIGFS